MRGSVTFEGKRYYVSGKDKTEIEVKKALKRKELEEGRKTYNKSMLVKDWAYECIDTYKSNQSYITQTKYVGRMRHCVLDVIGDMPLYMVKSIHLQKILNNQKQYSQRHINEIHQIINLIFNKAYENDLIADNPARGLIRPKGYSNIRRSLTKYEEERILPLLQEERYMIFALMYYAGLRPSEAENMTPSCVIDMNGTKMLHVIGTKTVNADRFIPVSMQLVSQIEKCSDRPYMALNLKGGKHTESSRRNCWHRLLEEAGLEDTDLVPYCLRHSFCTNLQKNDVPLKIAQTLMGHSDITLTANIYTHTDTDQLIRYANKL